MRKVFIRDHYYGVMNHHIMGETFQWLKIEIQSERIRGNYQHLLYKTKDIEVTNENVFSGTGEIIFSGNGKIRELLLGAADSLILLQDSILAADFSTKQEILSSTFPSLVKFSGPGILFVSGEDFVEFYIEEGETMEVKTDCIIAMDNTLTYQLGTTFSVVSGPGAVLLKSFIPKKEPRELSLFDRL